MAASRRFRSSALRPCSWALTCYFDHLDASIEFEDSRVVEGKLVTHLRGRVKGRDGSGRA